MDSSSSRGQDADPPIAEVVADSLDQHGPRVRNGVGSRHLILEIPQQILRGAPVEVVFSHETVSGRRLIHAEEVVHQPTDRKS